ncbi:ATP-binding protein [Actinoallomurus purpureus]|uniref:ATP-binding protein n=1 Tax=Actinoallomurus purpureus TaxID=478114 RepID=UPI002092A262|nr:ATP-binding protein [Actinoallomurus purpureus]MCO6010701.1 ATP-binding protein [Actinoallomurus purpureus]
MTQHLPSPKRPGRVAYVYAPGPDWVEIQPMPEAVAQVRHIVRRRLTHADPDFVYNVELVTSELVTNAIRCVRTLEAPASGVEPGIWFAIEAHGRWTRLRVRDPYPDVLPTKKEPDPTETNGRGMLISEAVADLVWVEVGDVDKVVHAVLAKPGVTLSPAEIAGFGR